MVCSINAPMAISQIDIQRVLMSAELYAGENEGERRSKVRQMNTKPRRARRECRVPNPIVGFFF